MPRLPIAALLLVFATLFAGGGAARGAPTDFTDSLMHQVFTYVERNGYSLAAFESEVYLRFRLDTRRRNIVCKYVPGLFALERGQHDYGGEALLRFRYDYPGTIDQKVLALHSTLPQLHTIAPRISDNVNLSFYDATLLTGRILSPAHARNRKFYSYHTLYRYAAANGDTLYHVEVRPRFHNTQLVQGYIEVAQRTGGVRRFDLSGYYDMTRLRFSGRLGRDGQLSLLPERLNFTTRLKLLGNRIDGTFGARIRYDSLIVAPSTPQPPVSPEGYDLTEQNHLKTDTTRMRTDRAFFDSIRPYPLGDRLTALYADTLTPPPAPKAKPSRRILTPRTEDVLFDSHSLGAAGRASLELPPLLTPSMFQWSRSKGFSLQTRLQANLSLPRDAAASAELRAGYNFKQRQFYWRVPASLLFLPELGGRLYVETGNGNIIYNSDQADAVRQALEGVTDYDTLIHVFDRFDFHYYRDFYAQGAVEFEPVVGLYLRAGMRFHKRTLRGWNDVAAQSGMARHLRSVAPHVHVEWTPGTYYYRDGHRRVPLRSAWPTFMVDYERGLRWGHCQAEYERWEADVRYRLRLYALRSLYFRLGAGLYTNQQNTYFVDFDNFRDNNMPIGWDDDLLGQFQLLDSRWYNESPYYVRFCAAYESPMLLFSRIKYLSNYIQKESVYCNLLSVHALQPYAELGYGFTTHLFNAAAFVSAANGAGVAFGAKFSLNLFNGW